MKIAIQGYQGCFHQIAAQNYFGKEVDILPCATFGELITRVNRKEAEHGVMAIENSIAGSILPNYTLLQKSGLHIMGETYLKIRQHLMALPGQKLSDIREVHSHPMALLQCMDFLTSQGHFRLVETEDTALSAYNLRQLNLQNIAAIAGKLAADLFDLEILVPNVHTEKKNYTRFLVVSRSQALVLEKDPNKSSIYFHTPNTRGALAGVLTRIAEEGVNLTKLQSFPIPGSEWKYYFHADMEFEDLGQFERVIRRITPLTESLKVLGTYKKGPTN
ncbi:MAG TPA: prephenate dehydratase [Chitinophagaceae bacterium]|nr:prephenate dehydratase [Chitinophagaceae bacterium]